MLIYLTKKLLMAFFYAFVEARYCIMCLFRMTAAEGGGVAALENSRRRREFLGRGESPGASFPGNF